MGRSIERHNRDIVQNFHELQILFDQPDGRVEEILGAVCPLSRGSL